MGQAQGIDNLLYSADTYFSCFADLALTSPEDYYKEGEGSLLQCVITPAAPYMPWTNQQIAEETDRQVCKGRGLGGGCTAGSTRRHGFTGALHACVVELPYCVLGASERAKGIAKPGLVIVPSHVYMSSNDHYCFSLCALCCTYHVSRSYRERTCYCLSVSLLVFACAALDFRSHGWKG